ncbi:unnamed protein product, partial [Amoebophrya sp. A25]
IFFSLRLCWRHNSFAGESQQFRHLFRRLRFESPGSVRTQCFHPQTRQATRGSSTTERWEEGWRRCFVEDDYEHYPRCRRL